jgi:hypothetical protein
MRNRVLILVLAMDTDPWHTIEIDGQRATWAKISNGDTPILWLYGRTTGPDRLAERALDKVLRTLGADEVLARFRNLAGSWSVQRQVILRGDKILTGVPESYLNANAKTIAGLRYLLRHYDFDFILRTNTSTYINLTLLMNHLKGRRAERYYGGFPLECKGVRYASGAGILVSRDVAEAIAYHPEWKFDLIDDMAIGKCMQNMGIPLQELERPEIITEEHLHNLDVESFRRAFLVRCKGINDREHDVRAMHRVHHIYERIGLE